MPFIETIAHKDAEGKLKEVYDNILSSRGKIAEVHKIQSLNPESIVNHMDLYMTIMYGKSPLKRVRREMMAVVVSKANNCEYCQTHHADAVNHYWKDDKKVEQLKQDYTMLDLTEQDRLLCDFAWELTKNPSKTNDQSYTNLLREKGLTDREILDGTLVVAYFNFVNRLVLSLGVNLEEDTSGFKYGEV